MGIPCVQFEHLPMSAMDSVSPGYTSVAITEYGPSTCRQREPHMKLPFVRSVQGMTKHRERYWHALVRNEQVFERGFSFRRIQRRLHVRNPGLKLLGLCGKRRPIANPQRKS
jgi:hypothetical protein